MNKQEHTENASDAWPGLFLDALGDAALILDAQGRVLDANRPARELYASVLQEGEELQGRELASLFHEDVAPQRRERLRHALETRAAQCFVDEERSRVLQHTLQPLTEQGGGLLMCSRDVTTQSLQDFELRRELQRQIFYFESLPGYVLLVRPDGEIVFANRLFKQLFGRPGEKKCHEFLVNSHARSALCPPEDFFTDGVAQQWEWEHPDGRVFQAHARPMTDVDKGLVALVLGMEVTEQRQTERALQQALEYQRAILDNIPDLVWLKDGANAFVAVNKAFAEASSSLSQNLEGGNHVTAWGEEQGRRLQQRDQEVLDAREAMTEEEEIQDVRGETQWLEAVRVPIFDAQGQLLGLVCIARDITNRKAAVDMLVYSHAEMERHVRERTARLRETVQQLVREVEERKRTQQALEKARQNAEVATRAKSLFLANMSHEIRTPLNVIITMADMALREGNEVERSRALEIVQEAGGTLLHVINDILDFSKIEARKLVLEHMDFDLRKVLEGVWGIYSLQARQNGLLTSLHVDMQIPSVVKGDPGRLRQVLGNLLANAVKFTREGRVELLVTLQKEGRDDKGRGVVTLRFEVRDTGVGLAQDKQQLVFESFQQADNDTTRAYGGTGLGLAIVKRLVELMQGEVGLESQPGKGSVFHVTVSFELGDAEALRRSALTAMAPQAPLLSPSRILLVEDNPLNMELVTAFLKGQGHEVLEAMDGLQALETLKTQCVDLILMDIQMPMLDGVAATQAIRKATSLAVPQDVPVVALTAHALNGDRERFLAAGMDGYVSKPVDLSLLQQEMARVAVGRPAVSSGQAAAGESSAAAASSLVGTPGAEGLGEKPERGLAGREKALALLQGNEKLLRRLDGHFLRDAPKDAAVICEALQERTEGFAVRIKEVAHSLKSQAATIGAERAAFFARSLEGAAAAGDLDSLPPLAQKLEEEVQEVVRWLQELPPL